MEHHREVMHGVEGLQPDAREFAVRRKALLVESLLEAGEERDPLIYIEVNTIHNFEPGGKPLTFQSKEIIRRPYREGNVAEILGLGNSFADCPSCRLEVV